MKHWTCRQLLIIIVLLASTWIAIVDNDFREDYGELVAVIVGGYFGQQLPQSSERDR